MKRSVEARIRFRFWLFTGLVLAVFTVLVFGLYNLQIVKGSEYAEEAGTASIRTIPVKGIRGMITDVNSVVLAKSEKVYNVTFMREYANENYGDITRSIIETIQIIERNGGSLSVTFPIRRDAATGEWAFNFGAGISDSARQTRESQWRRNHYLTTLSKYPTADACFSRLLIRYKFVSSDGTALIDADEATILKVMAVYSEMQMNLYLGNPVVIAKDVSFSAVSEIEGRSMTLPCMAVEVGEKRVYPRATLACTVVGYTGAIQSMDRYNELKTLGYSLNDKIGLSGVESTMENWLTASITERQGSRVMEKDPQGQLTRQVSYDEPADGNTIRLTIDTVMQAVAEKAIEDNVLKVRSVQEKKMQESKWLENNKEKIATRDWGLYNIRLAEHGVLIVLDVKTGRVLAMAQYPNYDLNAMIAGGEAAQEIVADKRGLLMNYATQTRAEPGSIFKMVTSLAALTNGAITPTTEITDMGKFRNYTSNEDEMPTCWANYPNSHVNQTIIQGLSNSCNYFFYTLASLLYDNYPTDTLYKFAAQIGLTSLTGIDLPGELRSVVGNQTNLYDPTVSLSEQMTSTPIIVANSIKTHIINYAAGKGLEYSEERLNRAIKRLMDMVLVTSDADDGWIKAARPILMEELNMTRTMVMERALMADIWVYLNDIVWGGSQEIQMGIGQSITLLTPVAVSRYVASLGNGGKVWNLQLIDSIISPTGEVLSERSPNLFNTLEGVDEFVPYIIKGMEGVVDESGTAGSYFSDWRYEAKEVMAGKTGTSQVTIGYIKLDLENNAWFVALAPKDDPEIAVVSFIPNGYSGGHATQAARDFIGWYLDEKNKVSEDIDLPGGNTLAP